MEPKRSSSELVDISVEARRRQVLNQLSTKLISELSPGEYSKKPLEPMDGEVIPDHRREGENE
jgi:hypothetical protein